MSSAVASAERIRALKRGRHLEYVAVGWNSLEALVSIIAGASTGSIALIGFGLDSIIETFSGAALIWRLRHANEHSQEGRERAEKIALRLVGLSFLALAVYVGIDAAITLWKRESPEHSVLGIIVTALSLIVMPVLARAKRRVAAIISSAAMHADSKQTDICAYLSVIVLGGLILNALVGWWWTDPVAALCMVPIIAKEGVAALRGDACGCHELPIGVCSADDCCNEKSPGTSCRAERLDS